MKQASLIPAFLLLLLSCKTDNPENTRYEDIFHGLSKSYVLNVNIDAESIQQRLLFYKRSEKEFTADSIQYERAVQDFYKADPAILNYLFGFENDTTSTSWLYEVNPMVTDQQPYLAGRSKKNAALILAYDYLRYSAEDSCCSITSSPSDAADLVKIYSIPSIRTWFSQQKDSLAAIRTAFRSLKDPAQAFSKEYPSEIRTRWGSDYYRIFINREGKCRVVKGRGTNWRQPMVIHTGVVSDTFTIRNPLMYWQAIEKYNKEPHHHKHEHGPNNEIFLDQKRIYSSPFLRGDFIDIFQSVMMSIPEGFNPYAPQVEFKSGAEEIKFHNAAGKCIICKDFALKGDLYFSYKRGCYLLKVSKYKMKIRSKNCCG